MTEWIQEGYQEPPEEPTPIPEHEQRQFGVAVPFARAFAPMTIARIAERLVKKNLPIVAAYGLLLTFATQMRFGLYVPITEPLDVIITGAAVRLPLQQAVLKIHLGTVLGGYVAAIICARMVGWVRDDGEDDFEAFLDFELGLRGMLYELMALGVQVVGSSPFLLGAMVAAEFGAEGAASLLCWGAVAATATLWMATRPGLWAVAIDDLPVRFALLQSLVLPLRYPHILGAVFGISFAILVVGFFLLAVPAIVALGVLQCSFAVAWILFSSSATEIDSSELLNKLVKVDRPRPL